MCNPTMIMAVGAIGQTMAAYQAANAQADAAEQNARLAEAKVAETEQLKQQQLADINEAKRQTIGTQRAAMAASGIDSSMGSGLKELTDTAYIAKQDRDETEFNAAKEEWGYKMEARNYRDQAAATRASAKSSLIGGILGATGQYMAGLDPVDKKWKPQQDTNPSAFKSAYLQKYSANSSYRLNPLKPKCRFR